jgi:hypothetical protein
LHRKELKRISSQITVDKGFIDKAYRRFLRLPVPVVLAVCWLVGTALIGLGALALYLLWLLL